MLYTRHCSTLFVPEVSHCYHYWTQPTAEETPRHREGRHTVQSHPAAGGRTDRTQLLSLQGALSPPYGSLTLPSNPSKQMNLSKTSKGPLTQGGPPDSSLPGRLALPAPGSARLVSHPPCHPFLLLCSRAGLPSGLSQSQQRRAQPPRAEWRSRLLAGPPASIPARAPTLHVGLAPQALSSMHCFSSILHA